MVQQENLFDKEKFKNKRHIVGTPLYKVATKYAKLFALGVGCMHVSLIAAGYYSNVSEEFLTAGPEQADAWAIRLGMYDMREDDTEIRLEQGKDEFKTTLAYEYYEAAFYYIGEIRKRFVESPETQPETKEGPQTSVETKEEPQTSKTTKLPRASVPRRRTLKSLLGLPETQPEIKEASE